MDIDHSLALNYATFNKPIIRFFGWEPYTLSLGYNQKNTDFNINQIKDLDYDIVRRPTGGRAIFHGLELTYSVIFPIGVLQKTEF